MTDIRSTMDEEGISDQVSQDPTTLTRLIELRQYRRVESILASMKANGHNARIQRYGCERIHHLLQQDASRGRARPEFKRFRVIGGHSAFLAAMSVHDDAETQYHAVAAFAWYVDQDSVAVRMPADQSASACSTLLMCMRTYKQHVEIVSEASRALAGLTLDASAVGETGIDILLACMQRHMQVTLLVNNVCVTLTALAAVQQKARYMVAKNGINLITPIICLRELDNVSRESLQTLKLVLSSSMAVRK